MRTTYKFYKPLMIALVALFVISCDDDDDNFVSDPSNTALTLVLNNSDFSSLRTAVELAGIQAELNNPTTQITVFAPDNDAFQDYLDNTSFASLQDVPQATLRNLLRNHIIAGEVTSSMLATSYQKTQGTNSDGDNLDVFVRVDNATDEIFVNSSLVISADNQVDNGVVHVVDEVIDFSTIVDLADANPDFSNLVTAIVQQDATNVFGLDDDGTFTVFAPSNVAFQALIDEDSSDDINDLNDVLGLSDLTNVLTYHVISGTALRAADFDDGDVLNPIPLGSSLTVDLSGTNPVLTDDRNRNIEIVVTDLTAINGVVHAINNVLLP